MSTPDPNAKAPRPKSVSSDDEPRPDMGNPPAAPRGRSAAFDEGTRAANDQAEQGGVPGPDDFAAIQAEGTADDSKTERAKHTAGSTNEDTNPGDDAPPGTPNTGEVDCPECGGTGRKNDAVCTNCDGTGTVVQGVGGA